MKNSDLRHCFFAFCRRGDLNPHSRKENCALNAARLPVPPLRHMSRRIIIIGDDYVKPKLTLAKPVDNALYE